MWFDSVLLKSELSHMILDLNYLLNLIVDFQSQTLFHMLYVYYIFFKSLSSFFHFPSTDHLYNNCPHVIHCLHLCSSSYSFTHYIY